MFERSFQRAMSAGARLLFLIAVVVFLGGVVAATGRLMGTGGLYGMGWQFFLFAVLGSLTNATIPLAGALIVDRIDLRMGRREPLGSPRTGPIMRRGASLFLWLSVIFFLLALAQLALWIVSFIVPEISSLRRLAELMTWVPTLSTASLLLVAAVAIDRFDRWLALPRP